MATIRINSLLQFPAVVEAGDGIMITRADGVFTFDVASDIVTTFGLAKTGAANTFTAQQAISTSTLPQLLVTSGSSSIPADIGLGRTALELQVGVAGVASDFFTGSVAGDGAVKSGTGSLWLGGATATPGIKIATGGSLTFPQHVSGALLTNASGVVTATTNTGTGNNVLQTSPTLVTPVLGVATATSINGLTITSSTGTLTISNGKTVSHSATMTFAGSDGKTLTISNTLTLAGTDGSTLNVGTGGTLGTAAYRDTGTSGNTVPLLDGANTFSARQIIQTASLPQLNLLSGNASNVCDLIIGRTTTELQIGVAASTNDFFTGSAAGDSAVKGGTGALWLGGATATPGIKISTVGALTFPQHVSGALLTNGSGVVTATTNTGSGNNVLATSPTLTTPSIGAATATSINGNTITSGSGTLTLQSSATLTVSSSTSAGRGQYQGTNTSDSATVGNIGEYVESIVPSGSEVSLTTVTQTNITSISLTAGDWDVTATANYLTASATNVVFTSQSISTTSATMDAAADRQVTMNYGTGGLVFGVANIRTVSQTSRLSLSGPTTIYLVCYCSFSVSTLKAWGVLRARRVR